ncbi:sarcosine oxidase subunit delta [Phenylobacterium sp.]|jgi:sarcosine oxidase subunit delta|uniref:sarcosine oxidase subunit delta n=1 Tax=Phenylobacterium sp. TaxID=1871053 RepID=UPI0037C84E7F
MLRIDCPHCGPRDGAEFVCGGESHIVRPQLAASDGEWASYLFERSNPRGLVRERWRHSFGCGLWFNLVRDTATHEIRATYRMGEAAPGWPS